MKSDLRESRPFHHYHQTQSYHGENYDRVGGQKGTHMTPTSSWVHKKSIQSVGSRTLTSTTHVVDDLTLTYNSSPNRHLATERDTQEYAISPNSSKFYGVMTLDGCYEEEVSPLLTDSSSSISSNKMKNVPIVPEPPLPKVIIKRESNAKSSTEKTIEKCIAPTTIDNVLSVKKEDTVTMTPPHGGATRRKCTHNRSRFVFDGNLSFGTITPSPRYATTPQILTNNSPLGCTFSPVATTTSMSGIERQTIPMLAVPDLTQMTPPQNNFFINRYNYRQQPEEQLQCQNQGRTTPPPTPKEQRQRNRAMPSVQYEDFVLNELRKDLFRTSEKGVLQRQQTW